MLVSNYIVVDMRIDFNYTSDLFGTGNTSTNEVNAFIGTVIVIAIIIVSNKSEALESNFNYIGAILDCHTLLCRSNRMAFLSSKDY